MSKYMDGLREKELVTKKPMTEASFNRAKGKNSKEVFEKHFRKVDVENAEPEYYRLYFKDVEDNEINTYLLYELLQEQRKTRKSIDVIKGIVIACIVISALGAIMAIASITQIASSLGLG